MGYQVYKVGNRWGGYGVPAICEHPDCKKEIDRGVSYACGEEPFSEYGCDRYFCEKHLHYTYFDSREEDGICKHEEDCDCETKNVCERCKKREQSFDYKPEHPTWMKHLIKDKSWSRWRKENPETVEEFKKALTIIKAEVVPH